jgi:hypothetical protein
MDAVGLIVLFGFLAIVYMIIMFIFKRDKLDINNPKKAKWIILTFFIILTMPIWLIKEFSPIFKLICFLAVLLIGVGNFFIISRVRRVIHK